MVLRIGVVADTHLPRFGRALPRALVKGMCSAPVDRILHLGDWTAPFVVELLAALAPVDGIAGNNDPPVLVDRLGSSRVVEIEGVRLGLTHGHVGVGRSTPERAARCFAREPGLAAILFGHSHAPMIDRRPDGPWLVNPGSPTDKRRQPRYTWVLMTVDAGQLVSAELIAYDDRSA